MGCVQRAFHFHGIIPVGALLAAPLNFYVGRKEGAANSAPTLEKTKLLVVYAMHRSGIVSSPEISGLNNMNLILLHGAPASGKYTIAKEISLLRGYPILHNHLTVDLALTVYKDFGEGDFFDFVAGLRSQCIEKACINKIENLIVTLCYDEAFDKPIIENWISILEKYQGSLYPIYLDVPVDELRARVVDKSRIGTNKLQSVADLDGALSKYRFVKIDHPNTIVLNSAHLGVSETAAELLRTLF